MAGSGASGGQGGLVTVDNSGVLLTSGDQADGIFAQSIGGGGGAGGSAVGAIAVGGSGSSYGSGGDVECHQPDGRDNLDQWSAD